MLSELFAASCSEAIFCTTHLHWTLKKYPLPNPAEPILQSFRFPDPRTQFRLHRDPLYLRYPSIPGGNPLAANPLFSSANGILAIQAMGHPVSARRDSPI